VRTQTEEKNNFEKNKKWVKCERQREREMDAEKSNQKEICAE